VSSLTSPLPPHAFAAFEQQEARRLTIATEAPLPKQVDLDAMPNLNRLALSLPLELRQEILRQLGTQTGIVNLAYLMLVSRE
jgi:CxxC motif-containing protein